MKKGQFVMIVDDDRDWAESVADLFQAYGYEVAIVGDGHQAVEQARRNRFDMVFMDVDMPIMNGIDSCVRIRQANPDAKIMMMSGVKRPGIDPALDAGALGLLEKPLGFERMLEVVETAA
jgi:two-component system response regulator MprA